MKNLLFFALILLVSCSKKDEVAPKTDAPLKYATLRIELTASKSSAPSSFTSTLRVTTSNKADGNDTDYYNSSSSKSNTITKEFLNVSDDTRLDIKGYSTTCDIPMTIKVYYDGVQIKNVSALSTCGFNNELSASTYLR